MNKVLDETGNNAVFNLDVTAGRRGGYHYFNEFGNLFLENRYTDWQNYYPDTTLRNLWMLSKYVPSRNLQIEFLNKWRNAGKYEGDPFAPSNYSFEYLFAITMAAQPLAWFEGVARYRGGETGPASICFERALRSTPWEVRVLNDYAASLYGLGQVDRAKAVLLRTLGLDPFFDDARFNLAAIYHFSGKPDSALYYVRQCRDCAKKDDFLDELGGEKRYPQ